MPTRSTRCAGCNNPLPKKAGTLAFCVYCGRPIKRIPAWIKVAAPLTIVCAIALVVAAIWPSLHRSPKPDLVVDAITLPRESVFADQDVTISVKVKNQGRANAPAFTVRCCVDDVEIGSLSVASLASGDVTVQDFTWRAQSGDHIVAVAADCHRQVGEGDEANNAGSVGLAASPAPDLIVYSMLWSPVHPVEGEEVTFTVTVKNQGLGDAGPFKVMYGEGGSVLRTDDVTFLKSGDTVVLNLTWTALAENHTISVLADGSGSLFESDESNNGREATFNVAGMAPWPASDD